MNIASKLKRSRLVWGTLLIALAAFGGVLLITRRASSVASRELQAAYALQDSAMRRKDLTALMAGFTPDYREQRLHEAPTDRHEAEARYRQAMADWRQFREQESDLFRVTLRGNEALVVVHRKNAGDFMDTLGAFGPAGKMHHLDISTLDVDEWVKMPEGWKKRFRNITSVNIKVDGQSFTRDDAAEPDHKPHRG